MKLKAILDNLDGVDDALKAVYAEKDGKFVLNIDGYDNHPEVQGLKKSLATIRTEKKALETELGEVKDKYTGLPDDFTVEEYNSLKDGGSGNVDQRLADQRKRLEDAAKAREDKITKERDEAKTKLNKMYFDSALNTAMADVGVAAPFIPAVRAMFKEKGKVDFEGEEVITTIDNMPVNDYLKTWSGTEIGKHYIAAANNGGGGSGGPGSGTGNKADNPWSKEGFNLTRQTELLREDPVKAEALKRAAGK